MVNYTKNNFIKGVPADKDPQVLRQGKSVASGDTLAVQL